jgi:8-oxo-dGTP diphosphatase
MRPHISIAELERWDDLDRANALYASVALVILTVADGRLQVLMMENPRGPYEGHFVLPHRMVRRDETLDEAAWEVFVECASQSFAKIVQHSTYSGLKRDPRGRVLTTCYVGAAPLEQMQWATNANDCCLLDVDVVGGVASLSLDGRGFRPGFDHDEVVGGTVAHLRQSIDYSLTPFSFLPEHFTLQELQQVHEAILGAPVSRPWFRRKMLKRVFEGGRQLVGTGHFRRDVPGKPAELYSLSFVSKASRTRKVPTRAIFGS